MSDYKNHIGQPIADYEQLKEHFLGFNHLIHLNNQQTFCTVSLNGMFFHNLINGDNYVISQYGIGKFSREGFHWSINDDKGLAKFIYVNQKISEQYAVTPTHENGIRFKNKFS